MVIRFLLLLIIPTANAADILVVDNNNEVVENAVIWFTPTQKVTSTAVKRHYQMQQKNRTFSPHILVVQQGSEVEFPNLDSIMHHVYSFSEAKKFELKLYRETPPQPLLFSQTGVVELGCNIHDWMLAYIVVVDSPFFTKTNTQGESHLALEPGNYTVNVWHERFTNISQPEVQTLMVTDVPIKLQLKQNLVAPFNLSGDEYDDYE